jgi:hypothetical protein
MISTCDQKLRKTHTSRIGSYRILSKISFIVFFLNKSYFFLNFFNNFILLSRWFDNGVAQLSCIASLHFKFQVSQKIIIIRKIYFSHFYVINWTVRQYNFVDSLLFNFFSEIVWTLSHWRWIPFPTKIWIFRKCRNRQQTRVVLFQLKLQLKFQIKYAGFLIDKNPMAINYSSLILLTI